MENKIHTIYLTESQIATVLMTLNRDLLLHKEDKKQFNTLFVTKQAIVSQLEKDNSNEIAYVDDGDHSH